MQAKEKTLDHYKVLHTLGIGSSCKVKLGEDKNTGKKVALKILSKKLMPSEIDEIFETEV